MNPLEYVLVCSRQKTVNRLELVMYLDMSAQNDLLSTISICFFIRDCRNGLGKRKVGRWCFNWIATRHPTLFIKLISYIPVYGRWDDLLAIENTLFESIIFQYISLQLQRDTWNMITGDSISYCAKWLPSEGKSFSKSYPEKFQRLLKTLKKTPREYRKYLKTLRRCGQVVEHFISTEEWNRIDYSTIPKKSLVKHKNLLQTLDPMEYKQARLAIGNRIIKDKLSDIMDDTRYKEFYKELQVLFKE